MPVDQLWPEIVVLLAAVALLLLALFLPQPRHGIAAPLALAALALAALFCARQLQVPAHFTFHGTWVIDAVGVLGRLLMLAACAGCVLLAPDWLRSDRRHGEYYAVLLLGLLGAMAMAAAADLQQLVMGVLLSSVTGYTLAAYHRQWALSLEAGMKYFLIGLFANTVLVLGVALLFGVSSGTGLAQLAPALAAGGARPLALAGFVLVLVGLCFKLGAVPAHAWVPDVAQGAPVPSAAFLTIVPKIAAAIAIARLVQALPPDAVAWRPLLAALSLVTMTLGNLMALWQTDLRRLLGWSSVSQAGYVLMALVVLGTSEGAAAALLFFLAAYAAAQLCAFAVVAHLRGRTELASLAGLARVRPWTAAALVLALLSMVGLPPLAGFVGKLGLFLATMQGGYTWLAVAAAINTAVSLFYYLRVLAPLAFGTPAGEVHTLGRWSAIAMGVGALLVLALGIAGPLWWPRQLALFGG